MFNLIKSGLIQDGVCISVFFEILGVIFKRRKLTLCQVNK